jgi:hypothetical protein
LKQDLGHTKLSPNLKIRRRSCFKSLACLVLFSTVVLATEPVPRGIAPARLRCEYRVDPLGIDSAHPRLDWIVQAVNPAAHSLAQSAFQVLAASSPDFLAHDQGDLWDSGRIYSDQTNQIAYSGKPLSSNEAVWWKVKVWDQAGAESAWSPVGQWTMGILRDKDWAGAEWIGAPDANQPANIKGPKASYETVLLRREFNVKPGLRRALVHVCGLGQYELTLNGRKVGDDLLTPGWTMYNKTCLYNTYDITPELRAGRNAAGLFLGNGFFLVHAGRYTKITQAFGQLQAIALIRLEYQDGTVDAVVTDNRWKTAPGPITFSSIYGGEDYDARLAQDGWDKFGFADSKWEGPAITAGPGGTLKGLSASGLPIRIFAALTPVRESALVDKSKRPSPGVTVYDLGQNAAIMLRLKGIRGPAGSSIKVTAAELVNANADINDTMCGRGRSYWTYTLSGKGAENYFSHFYYRGGRYLKVELRPAPGSEELPAFDSIEGDVVHADSPAVGQFSCSNDLYNKIYSIIRWAQMNNMFSVMTDCPTREKLGWLEEDHLNGPALRYNFDMAALMTKMVCDMGDSQRPNGLVPSTCPDYLRHPDNNQFANPPEWGSACIIVPWQQYEFDGDVDLLRAQYEVMKRYIAYLKSSAKAGILNFGLGDWYDNLGFGAAKLTPISLTATAFYYQDVCIMAQIATMLDKAGEAIAYRQMGTDILAAFNQKFFNSATDNYATGSQASNAVPLALHMVAPSERTAVLANVVRDFQAKQTTVGEVCLEFLINALAEGGHSDLLYTAYESGSSGYGLQVKQGKTSLAEGWNGGSSQDHFMFGQLNEWLFSHLAGIQCDPDGPGFKKIVIAPSVIGDLTAASASYDSIAGKIVSEWRRTGSNVTYHVIIPPNTTATVYVPPNRSGAGYHIGSGDYTFAAPLQ